MAAYGRLYPPMAAWRFYDDMLAKGNKKAQDVDMYICGFCCQPFSSSSPPESFRASSHVSMRERVYALMCGKQVWMIIHMYGNIQKLAMYLFIYIYIIRACIYIYMFNY